LIGEKWLILQIILFYKKLMWPLFSGHLGLSNGILLFGIGYFPVELWTKETHRYSRSGGQIQNPIQKKQYYPSNLIIHKINF
jgi:hypothetical protein